MSQYALLIGLLLVLFAVAVLVAYLMARIAVLSKQVEMLEKERLRYQNLLEKREQEKEELSERLKEYEKNIAVLNEQMEMLKKERARQLDRIKEDYEKLLEERKREKDELSERLKEYEKINKELFEQLKEYEKNIAVLNEQMDKSAYERAQKLFEEWREKELENLKDVIKKEYENRFEKWKNEYEEKIREDSRKKSLSTILGKVGEEIEPKDFRHIGTPIDYVAFKGLSNGKVEEILFIEVKTANSPSLSDQEKEVRKAVEDKRVRFVMINLKEELYNFRFE
jgi:predicted Holliday junction resolvase-like endonuclease